MAALIPRSWS